MNKTLLVTRPNHDFTTNYLYWWSESVIKEALKKRVSVYDLKGDKANKKVFYSYIKSHKPGLLFLNGHGNPTTISGHNNQPLLDTSSVKKIVESTIIYARSCDAGSILGIKLVSHGARAFIGYRRKFTFGYTNTQITKPLSDRLAKLFLAPSNLVPTTLIKGHSTEDAHHRSLAAMRKNFKFMISSTATFEQRYTARWLYSNIKSQVLLGDPQAKLS